jgi:dethiobiotin synthetase
LLWNALDGKFPHERICPQRFTAPLAPPVAARIEQREVNAPLLQEGAQWWRGHVETLLVEGVGGWKCPLTETTTVADLAIELKFPVLIVAANRLGMMNHTLLTLESVEKSGLSCLGVVVNCPQSGEDGSEYSNIPMLRGLSQAPIFGPLPWTPQGTPGRGEFFDRLSSSLLERVFLPRHEINSPHD